uniref:Uncharacterized protein n=1 Tax=Anopheles albimanus TaxID=7167 RepID=A0A182FYX1_ANOAL
MLLVCYFFIYFHFSHQSTFFLSHNGLGKTTKIERVLNATERS